MNLTVLILVAHKLLNFVTYKSSTVSIVGCLVECAVAAGRAAEERASPATKLFSDPYQPLVCGPGYGLVFQLSKSDFVGWGTIHQYYS